MDEKMRILKMVEEKKITADEAAELLTGIEGSIEKSHKPLKWLRIKVWENEDGKPIDPGSKPKVNVNLPLSLARKLTKFIPADKADNMEINLGGEKKVQFKDLDIDELMETLDKCGPMTLVEVEEEDTKVIITLE